MVFDKGFISPYSSFSIQNVTLDFNRAAVLPHV